MDKTITVKRLINTGRKYGMEMNIDKSQVMRVSRSNESLQIKVNNRELKEVDHFKYLGTRDGYCTREIKMRFTMFIPRSQTTYFVPVCTM